MKLLLKRPRGSASWTAPSRKPALARLLSGCGSVLAIAMFALLMTKSGLAQGQVFVDPVNGSNVLTGGGPTNPFQTIGFAINHPSAPDDIRLRPGFYNEDVFINRDLSLQGTGPGVTLTPMMANGTAITITDAAAQITAATKIKNLAIRNCSVGVRIVGTPAGLGVSPELLHLTFALFERAIEIESSNNAFNDVRVEFCRASGGILPTPFTRGLTADITSGTLLLQMNACTISVVETGIEILGNGGQHVALLDNILINTCERGVAVDGGPVANPLPVVVIRQATIADDFPSIGPNSNAIEVAANTTAVVTLENSILWMIQPNSDNIEAPAGTVTAVFTDSNDPADVLLDPTNNLIPATGPGFGGGSFPYQLLPTSMAVDTGSPGTIAPTAPAPLATDRVGIPRFSDGNRTGILSPDRGAFEFCPVAMDVVQGPIPPAQAFNVTPLNVGVLIGTQFSIVGSSRFPSATADLAVVSIDFANNTNAFLPGALEPMGNLLVAPTSTLTMTLSGTTAGGFHGAATLTAPGLAFVGAEVDYQVGFFSTDGSVAGPGNLSRRVRVEFIQ